jgi:hypothetical protein
VPRLLRLALLVKQPRPRIPDKIPSACATGVPLLGSFHKSFLHRIFLNVGRDKSRLPRHFDECGFAGQDEKRYGARAFQFANAIRFRGPQLSTGSVAIWRAWRPRAESRPLELPYAVSNREDEVSIRPLLARHAAPSDKWFLQSRIDDVVAGWQTERLFAHGMNGSTVIGLTDFFGLDKRKHQLLSGTLGYEFIAKCAACASNRRNEYGQLFVCCWDYL